MICAPGITFDGTVPLVGDWTASGSDDLALFHRQSGTFLFYELDAVAGTCELIWEVTQRDAADTRYLPMAGDWDFWHTE